MTFMTPNRDPAAIVAHDLFTAFGAGAGPAWQALLEGRHSFVPCLRFHNKNLENLYGALSPELESETDPSGFFLHAMAPSVLPFADRAELLLAATVGEIEYLEDPRNRCTVDSLLERALRTFCMKHGMALSAACASGNAAVCRACSLLAAGRTECAAVFGSDSVSEFILSGFATLKAVSMSPLCRPYDRTRDGLLLGDAAGTVVLMSRARAEAEGLPVLGLVTGWGMSCDATHITAPLPDGTALAQAVRQALARAGRTPGDVGAVVGHGTGTVYNDIMEIRALKQVFGESALPPLLSVKGSSGHTLACAGIVQLSAALNMLKTGRIPPQTSLREPEPEAGTMLSACERRLERKVILIMNSGFGGLNAVLLLEAAS